MKDNRILTPTRVLLVVSISLALVLLNMDLSFAQETGSIEVEIRFTNQDRISNWQTVLEVYQDNNQAPFTTIEFPDSNPYVIESLPLGHKYTVKVFVNNMYAGEGFISKLDKPTSQLDINIPLQGGIRFVVLYNDGQTPIEDATVSVKSYDGYGWIQGTTNDEGKTIRFWLQSSNLRSDDYYIADVSLADGLSYSHSPINILPGDNKDIEIKTPWPKKIENLITISVYDEDKEKVSKSDGKFLVELYDSKNNKVGESPVNIRGESFFSLLKVGQYTVKVIKTSETQEPEIWATKSIVLSGKERQISVYKKGAVAADSVTCNCVAFRLDDIQDYYLRGAQVAVMELFQQKNADLTVGIIGGAFGEDPHLVNFLQRSIANKNPTIEIASHSFNTEPLAGREIDYQKTLLEKTNQILVESLGVKPNVLIPPQNLFDENTMSVLPDVGITHVSAHIEEIDSPPYLVEGLETYSFPAVTQTAKLNPDGVTWKKEDPSKVIDDVQNSIEERGYAVVMMHPYEFSVRELGFYTGEADKQMIGNLGEIIDAVNDLNLDIVTIGEIEDHIVQEGETIKGPEKPADIQNCECVAFRFSAVQDYWLNDVQIRILDTFLQNDSPVTAGIVANKFGEDKKLVNHIKTTLENESPLIEIANNGWNYEDFIDLASQKQSSIISQSVEKISSVLGTKPKVFIPPYEHFNEATISALKENNVKYINSDIKNDPPPYNNDQGELNHFPSSAATGRFNAFTGIIEPNSHQEIYAEVQKSLDEHGFAVVTVATPEFSVVNDGNYINQVNEEKIEELESLIAKIQSDDLKIVKISQISEESGAISIPTWVKNNAGWWSEGQIEDSDFVSGIQFLINKGIIRIPPSEDTSGSADRIPSWVKVSAGWWSQGVVSDEEFVSGIQWLINNGIIKIGDS